MKITFSSQKPPVEPGNIQGLDIEMVKMYSYLVCPNKPDWSANV